MPGEQAHWPQHTTHLCSLLLPEETQSLVIRYLWGLGRSFIQEMLSLAALSAAIQQINSNVHVGIGLWEAFIQVIAVLLICWACCCSSVVRGTLQGGLTVQVRIPCRFLSSFLFWIGLLLVLPAYAFYNPVGPTEIRQTSSKCAKDTPPSTASLVARRAFSTADARAHPSLHKTMLARIRASRFIQPISEAQHWNSKLWWFLRYH